MLPARILSRSRRSSPTSVAVAGVAGAALVIGLAAPRIVESLRSNFRSISITHDTGQTFTREVTRALPLIDTRRSPRHSVAMLGAVDNSELAWVLGVPYSTVVDHVEPATRLIVQPSPATWARLKRYEGK